MSSSQISNLDVFDLGYTQFFIYYYCMKDVEFVSFLKAGEGGFECPGTRGKEDEGREFG